MRKLRLSAAALIGAGLALGPSAAHAVDGWIEGAAYTNEGAAKVQAYVNFTGKYSVKVTNITLWDLCPADGDSVYIHFQYRQAGGSWVTRGEERRNSSGCSSTGTSEASYDFTATSGAIDDVRLKVCVDETWPNGDECAYTTYRDNPYYG